MNRREFLKTTGVLAGAQLLARDLSRRGSPSEAPLPADRPDEHLH